MEGFEGLIKNDWGRKEKVSFIDAKFQVLSLAYRYLEFIHSCPTFSSMKIVKAGTGMEKKGEKIGNETVCISLLPYFSSLVVSSHSRTHIRNISFPLPTPRLIYALLFFIQLFQASTFIEEISFPFSCFSFVRNFKD